MRIAPLRRRQLGSHQRLRLSLSTPMEVALVTDDRWHLVQSLARVSAQELRASNLPPVHLRPRGST